MSNTETCQSEQASDAPKQSVSDIFQELNQQLAHLEHAQSPQAHKVAGISIMIQTLSSQCDKACALANSHEQSASYGQKLYDIERLNTANNMV